MSFAVGKPQLVRKAYAGPWSKLGDAPLDKRLLHRIGRAMVRMFVQEASRDFQLRGWSMKAPDGGKPIDKSFSYRLAGESSVAVLSSYPGLAELVQGIQPRKLTWLTQEHKDKHPSRHELSPRERFLRMSVSGRVSKHARLPLVVPLRDRGGQIVFRMAPLTMADAWVHPGIARFTFAQRAVTKARKLVSDFLLEELSRRLVEGDPFK